MYCAYCGKEIKNEAVVCPYCGCPTQNNRPTAKPDDAKSAGFAVLGFFFPMIGLILYLVWMNDYPLRAKSAGKGALISVIVSVAFVILYIILCFIIFVVLAAQYAAVAALML